MNEIDEPAFRVGQATFALAEALREIRAIAGTPEGVALLLLDYPVLRAAASDLKAAIEQTEDLAYARSTGKAA